MVQNAQNEQSVQQETLKHMCTKGEKIITKISTKQEQKLSPNNTTIIDLEMKGNARWKQYLKTSWLHET